MVDETPSLLSGEDICNQDIPNGPSDGTDRGFTPRPGIRFEAHLLFHINSDLSHAGGSYCNRTTYHQHLTGTNMRTLLYQTKQPCPGFLIYCPARLQG